VYLCLCLCVCRVRGWLSLSLSSSLSLSASLCLGVSLRVAVSLTFFATWSDLQRKSAHKRVLSARTNSDSVTSRWKTVKLKKKSCEPITCTRGTSPPSVHCKQYEHLVVCVRARKLEMSAQRKKKKREVPPGECRRFVGVVQSQRALPPSNHRTVATEGRKTRRPKSGRRIDRGKKSDLERRRRAFRPPPSHSMVVFRSSPHCAPCRRFSSAPSQQIVSRGRCSRASTHENHADAHCLLCVFLVYAAIEQ
jgi:hypothetical protein